MSYQNAPFTIRQGDDRVLEIDVNEPDGSPSPLNDAQVLWTYGRSASSPGRVSKARGDDGVSVDAGRGVIVITLGRAETASLEAYQVYRFQCRVTLSDLRETVATGSFSVEPSQGEA